MKEINQKLKMILEQEGVFGVEVKGGKLETKKLFKRDPSLTTFNFEDKELINDILKNKKSYDFVNNETLDSIEIINMESLENLDSTSTSFFQENLFNKVKKIKGTVYNFIGGKRNLKETAGIVIFPNLEEIDGQLIISHIDNMQNTRFSSIQFKKLKKVQKIVLNTYGQFYSLKELFPSIEKVSKLVFGDGFDDKRKNEFIEWKKDYNSKISDYEQFISQAKIEKIEKSGKKKNSGYDGKSYELDDFNDDKYIVEINDYDVKLNKKEITIDVFNRMFKTSKEKQKIDKMIFSSVTKNIKIENKNIDIEYIDFSELTSEQINKINFTGRINISRNFTTSTTSKIKFKTHKQAYDFCVNNEERIMNKDQMSNIIVSEDIFENISENLLVDIFKKSNKDYSKDQYKDTLDAAIEDTMYNIIQKFKNDKRNFEVSIDFKETEKFMEKVFYDEMNYQIQKLDLEDHSSEAFRYVEKQKIGLINKIYIPNKEKLFNSINSSFIVFNNKRFYINSSLKSKIEKIINKNDSKDIIEENIKEVNKKIEYYLNKFKEEKETKNKEEETLKKIIKDKEKIPVKKESKFLSYFKKAFSKNKPKEDIKTEQKIEQKKEIKKSNSYSKKDFSNEINNLVDHNISYVYTKIIESFQDFNKIYKDFTNIKTL